MEISPDRLTAHVKITDFGKGDQWLDRIYHLTLDDTAGLFSAPVSATKLEAYHTLRAIP
jgi:hypothetical protein